MFRRFLNTVVRKAPSAIGVIPHRRRFASSQSRIIESLSIRRVVDVAREDSTLVFDLDHTVFQTAHRTGMGGEFWFEAMLRYACDLEIDHAEAVAMVLAVYNEVQSYVRVRPVESEVVDLILEEQRRRPLVMALTARGPQIKAASERQLKSIGVDFKDHVVYCDGQNKGVCLTQSLEERDYTPSHAVMADDKREPLEQVGAEMNAAGVDFDGVRYGYLDRAVDEFCLTASHVELEELRQHFPPHVNDALDRLNITRELEQPRRP